MHRWNAPGRSIQDPGDKVTVEGDIDCQLPPVGPEPQRALKQRKEKTKGTNSEGISVVQNSSKTHKELLRKSFLWRLLQLFHLTSKTSTLSSLKCSDCRRETDDCVPQQRLHFPVTQQALPSAIALWVAQGIDQRSLADNSRGVHSQCLLRLEKQKEAQNRWKKWKDWRKD